MKRLVLSAQRVRALLLSNKLISALYLIGGMLAIFSMFFMYMTVISQDKYENKEGYYTYTLLSGSEDEDESFSFDRGRRPPPALRAVWMIRKIFAGAVFMPTAGSAIYARPYRKAIWIYLFNPLF